MSKMHFIVIKLDFSLGYRGNRLLANRHRGGLDSALSNSPVDADFLISAWETLFMEVGGS